MGALADIIRAAEPAYRTARGDRLSAGQQRALTDIARCRTSALGGTMSRCEHCGTVAYQYHSCRNRHCPTCQADRAQAWLARTQAKLLPCDHYLLTFTLPSELRAVARQHPRLVYAALLREAAAAVQTLAGDRQWVGGTVGILAVLHTWSRTLEYHPHAHLLVTAGGLSPDGTAWVKPASPRFFMPGYALSHRFRARMQAVLTRAKLIDAVHPRVWRCRWTVHVAPIGSGQHATLYLSRYIYRVAITEERIERSAGERVTFRYSHARTGETRRVTLGRDQFLDRFLTHVLPRRFTKVRSYGLLSPSQRPALERVRTLLTQATERLPAPVTAVGDPVAPPVVTGAVAIVVALLALRCPQCQQGLRVVSELPRMDGGWVRGPPH